MDKVTQLYRYSLNPQAAAQELHNAWEGYRIASRGPWTDPEAEPRFMAARERVDRASALVQRIKRSGMEARV